MRTEKILHPEALSPVLSLESPNNTLEASGGKGSNLGIMLRAGLPVPRGFCISTAAYQQIASLSEQSLIIDELATIGNASDPRLASLAERMRASFQNIAIPSELERTIVEAYESLGADTPVAVRSSANAEDLPTASFAGQQDTYLGIVGSKALLMAIRNCWASLWNERAVRYRVVNRIDPRSVRLAVVVQHMVDSHVAGVLFTANPLSGCRRQAVIDANPGLGEAVVSGAVNPDHFILDRISGAIVERRLGDKRLVIRQVAGGGTVTEEMSRQDLSACLNDLQLHELVDLGAKVERHFGAPQDIEYAFDAAGTLWLTQARPITTLYPLPPDSSATDLRTYLSLNVFQGMLQPFTPMGVQGFRFMMAGATALAGYPLTHPAAGPSILKVAGQRIYADLTAVLCNPLGRRLMFQVLPHMEARSAKILKQLAVEKTEFQLQGHALKTLGMLAKVMGRTLLPHRILWALRHPDRAVERARIKLQAPILDVKRSDPLEAIEEQLQGIVGSFLEVAPSAIAGVIAGMIAKALLKDLANAQELDTIRRALPNNPTTEMDLALWTLSLRLKSNESSCKAFEDHPPAELANRYQAETLPPALQEGLRNFLQTYGQRGLTEIDLGSARWSDDPGYLLGILGSYLRMEDPELAPDHQFKRGQEEAEGMVAELTRRASRGHPLRGKLVGLMLHRMRTLLGLREGHKFILVTVLAWVRRQLQLVGEQLVNQGTMEEVEDIFFLDLAEVRRAREGEDVRAIVLERRKTYDQEKQRRLIPRVMLSDGTIPTADSTSASTAEGELVGTPASAGIVKGIARVIVDPRDAKLAPGEILVAPSTDPGWTPLFLTASGLVMEMGGAMSHGAVVAREYGIPAVVGVPLATEGIPDGALVEVDGESGKIRILDAKPSQKP